MNKFERFANDIINDRVKMLEGVLPLTPTCDFDFEYYGIKLRGDSNWTEFALKLNRCKLEPSCCVKAVSECFE